MLNKISYVKTIAIGLAVLYAISFLVNLEYFRTPVLKQASVVNLVLFGLLFISAVATAQIKEWGRVALLFLNIVLAAYLIKPYLVIDGFMPIAYVLMNLIVLMFFTQDRIRIQFKTARVKSGEWKSVLVIDDDESLIKTIRPILISHGYSVLTAFSGEDGLMIAKAQKPDVVLLDVILPGIKGRDVCRKIKDDPQTKDIPVIFFTAKDSADDIQAEMEAGAEDHITKPIDPKSVINTIEYILKK